MASADFQFYLSQIPSIKPISSSFLPSASSLPVSSLPTTSPSQLLPSNSSPSLLTIPSTSSAIPPSSLPLPSSSFFQIPPPSSLNAPSSSSSFSILGNKENILKDGKVMKEMIKDKKEEFERQTKIVMVEAECQKLKLTLKEKDLILSEKEILIQELQNKLKNIPSEIKNLSFKTSEETTLLPISSLQPKSSLLPSSSYPPPPSSSSSCSSSSLLPPSSLLPSSSILPPPSSQTPPTSILPQFFPGFPSSQFPPFLQSSLLPRPSFVESEYLNSSYVNDDIKLLNEKVISQERMIGELEKELEESKKGQKGEIMNIFKIRVGGEKEGGRVKELELRLKEIEEQNERLKADNLQVEFLKKKVAMLEEERKLFYS